MLDKKERTLERYMRAGAGMRLYRELGTRLAMDISEVLPAADTDRLLRAMDKIDRVCTVAEDNMFKDHPGISNEYLDVFYGAIDGEPRNEVDRKVIRMAREAADGLFKGKGD